MKFIRSESFGPYVVFMSGEDGKEVNTQIFVRNKITVEKTNSTKAQAEKWVLEHYNRQHC